MRIKRKLFVSVPHVLIGGGLLAGGTLANRAFIKDMTENMSTDRNKVGDRKVKKELEKEFKKKYGKHNLSVAKGLDNAFALPSEAVKQASDQYDSLNKRDRKKLEKEIIKKKKKGDLEAFAVEAIIEANKHKGSDKPVVVSGDKFKAPEVLAHELGHVHYFEDEDAEPIGKTAHKMRTMDNGLVHLGVGALSGLSKGGVARIVGYGTPTGNLGVHLAQELPASYTAMKKLKKHGATKEDLDKYEKSLKSAAGTYLTSGIANIGSATLGRGLTKHLIR